ncbi:mechanosensitive ion channel family protein [Polyangium jinanense]|uniref:Mechanosensitive ion channel family protein n=1 Tax=Polyangium jinanense TaxID=2829994 RepID=A0A9X4B0E3_9BACT|nr:mechanosensitive ion channel family protein [Polyangium jinanense]MDC3962610.1 mechanosensitive ion channel family protein [Polyangium jinanense]MDC3989062.1 mechanosensitive ion channel family protein [Polyangium jinanense]
MTLPNLDLLVHNLVALCIVIVVLMLLSQLIVTAILRLSSVLLSASVLGDKETVKDVGAEFRRRVRRSAVVGVALLGLLSLAAMGFLSLRGLRALDLALAFVARLREDASGPFKTRLLSSVGIILGALVVDAVARAIVAALGKGLANWKVDEKRRESLAEALIRLRTALRTVILGGTAVLVAGELAPDVQRGVLLGAYILGAFYVSRFVANAAHVLVDVLFDRSTRLTRLESPLKYLGSLTHLAPITKRVIDYFVYLSAATWVADAFTPDTWLAQGGRIGIRILAIFYASRVLVELCVLFVQEIFLGNVDKDGEKENLQQRRTLVPVAVGFLRYGIYFSALVMVLREASIDPTPLLAGAGVIGVAIGLGAQAFVGDIVAGFFILFENLLLVGDLVEVSGVRGKVEEIGVRITKIRDDSGVLHAIPNGEVRKVANHSKAYVNAIVDVHVPYEEDLTRVRSLLASVAEKALSGQAGANGPVEVKVQELNEGSVLLRVIARVPPGQDEDLGDLLRERIVDELREAKIGAPRPRRAVLIESKIRVGAPPPPEPVEEDSGPPQPFSPPAADA